MRFLINKRSEIMILVFLLALCLFTHFFHLFDYYSLTGDPARDALTIRNLFTEGKFTLIGPKASAGGFYYGPLFFYLLAIPYYLNGFRPITSAIVASFLDLATVFLMYFLAKKYLDKKTAIFSAVLYSVCAFSINQIYKGWNPAFLPFFSLLSLAFFMRFLEKKNFKDLLLWGLSFGIGLQLHFALIFSLPIYLILIYLNLRGERGFYKYLFLSLFFIVIFFLPLVIFDIRHKFILTESFWQFLKFGPSKEAFGLSSATAFHPPMSISYFFFLISQPLDNLILIAGKYLWILNLVFLLSSLSIACFIKSSNTFIKNYRNILVIYLLSIFTLGLYSGPIHPYYWVYILPHLYLLLGVILSRLYNFKPLGSVLAVMIFGGLLINNLVSLPFNHQPKRTIKDQEEAALIIASDSKFNKDNLINIVMFSDQDAAHSAFEYRYLVEYFGQKVLPAEDYQKATKLYIVSEQGKIDDLLALPVMEIRDFKGSRVEKEWQTGAGYKIYRLAK